MRFGVIALACAALVGGPALAQDPAAPPPAAPPAKKGPPSRSITLVNGTDTPTKEVVIQAGTRTVRVDKPIAPQGRTAVRLPPMRGCSIALAAVFEDDGRAEIPAHDVCKDRSIRFTN